MRRRLPHIEVPAINLPDTAKNLVDMAKASASKFEKEENETSDAPEKVRDVYFNKDTPAFDPKRTYG